MSTPSATERVGERRKPLRLVLFMPLAAFIGLAAVFVWGLGRDPSQIPSQLVGKPVPGFTLPPVQGRTLGFSSTDLKGEVSLVNVFASWCVACRDEHPLLMELKENGIVPVHGINYKDRPEDAARWLGALGDPYTRTGADTDGRVAIDWGVYGVPETFIVDGDGTVVYKQIGPITEAALRETILPLVERLQAE
ncbi:MULTISPECIES: DsbE family thiol:disulfide interchange protein [Aurantimonadaceae]|uniref:DsbE family thiol:disulfide interchange protein n=1 Tax=Jiella pacifica TaxID=2696469 RepID=A0A6N9T980_9HYPH|nr:MULTISPECIES: DsbE family thiol:disulfide interchange protein [Aurantimonadaceae]MCK5932207.1 DsbE family thiol:disulfide interchange protein [Fulvimarina manganoxydans]NDW07973.1 DsbE family thiol:disulfide interchange protein [Jiella pacifica]